MILRSVILGWLAAWLLCGPALAAPQGRLAACPPTPRPPTSEEQAAGLHGARDRGILWRAEKNGRTSWLYGTIHIGKASWTLPGPAVRAAFERSDTLALELDPLDPDTQSRLQAGMARNAQLTLTPALQHRLRSQLRQACMPAVYAEQVAPEMLAASLTMSASAHDGFHALFGIDLSLAQLARTMNKPVIALETVERQLAGLISINEADLRDNMAHMLDDLERGRVRPLARRLALAWEAGLDDELRRFPARCGCVGTPRARAQLKLLLDDRNPDLANAVDRLHASGKSVFAAVGSLHLVGPQGLPALMARRGYRVTREPLPR